MLPIFGQAAYRVRFERGESGLRAVGTDAAVIIVVDVLSFSSAVDVAVARGASIRPIALKDEGAAQIAVEFGAVLAVPRSARSAVAPYSLSPPSLATLPKGLRLVLPSPNGAALLAIASRESNAAILAGCLRNASAVAAFAREHAQGRPIAVIAAGERWPDGTLRPALEDDLGAGAIIQAIASDDASPEARSAAGAFVRLRESVAAEIRNSVSGRELIEIGHADDIDFAVALDAGGSVPLLDADGFIRQHGRLREVRATPLPPPQSGTPGQDRNVP